MRAVSINDDQKFAVTECSILTSDDVRIILFAPGAETSPTCEMESIGLVAAYESNNFNFQHMLFQLNEAGHSTYKLECTAEICEKNDPASACNEAVLPCILSNTYSSENSDSNQIAYESNRLKHAYMCDGFCNSECTVENNTPICSCAPGQELQCVQKNIFRPKTGNFQN